MEQPTDARSGRDVTSRRLTKLVPSGIAVLVSAACGLLIVMLRARNDFAEPEGVNWWLVAWLVVGGAYGAAGAGLVWRRRFRVLGVLFLVVAGAGLLAAVTTQYEAYVTVSERRLDRPLLATASDWAWALGGSVLATIVPWHLDGRRGPRWSALVQGVAAMAIGLLVGSLGARDLAAAADPPSLEVLAGWLAGALGLVAMVAQWRRWSPLRTAGDPLAAWLMVGTAAGWLSVVLWIVRLTNGLTDGDVVGPLLLLATVPLLVLGALVELVRSSQHRPERLSPRVVEWAMLALGIVLLYTVLVAGLGTLLGGDGPTWFLVAATGLVAIAIEPARRRIRRLVDRMVYGSRDDPLSLVQSIVDHVQSAPGEDLLPSLVASLASELCLDAVAIDLATPTGWVRAAAVGPDAVNQRELPLRHQDEMVGRLVVGWIDGPSIRARDEQVLQQLSGALGMAVSWVRVAVELRRSGLAVVSAREEERRRLRRDLHDGVGPALTGISLGLRTAVKQLDRRGDAPEATLELLARLSDEIDAVVADIKRIARDLRPTALDELGLVGAITEFTRRFNEDLEIELCLTACPSRLPAVIEVAVYRIVTEAITNVVRHAHAQRCSVTIAADRTVDIDIVDDGVGMDERRSDGVGLTAMRERAAELGGVVRLAPALPAGTHLQVILPAALP